jgi:outer membrane protein assembly factor BamD
VFRKRPGALGAGTMKRRLIALLLISIGLFSGCAWFGKDNKEKPAQELIQEGVDDYEKGNYSNAIKSFEQLKDWYPFSKYAILAELKIADAHYQLAQYAEAVQAYEEFEQLHPRNEAVAYVIYQTGRCYYDQISSIDRDQTSAQKALEIFQRLVRQHPQDPYAHQSLPHITKCLQNLAGHEFYVGQFYYRTKHYQAALKRFMTVINNYPDVGMHFQALKYVVQCEALVHQSTLAQQSVGKKK